MVGEFGVWWSWDDSYLKGSFVSRLYWKLYSLRIGNFIQVRSELMGSEGPKSVTIHVTGFKKFHGVSENPTESIVSNLNDLVGRRGLPTGVTLGSCTVLETAGDGALPMLYNIMESGVVKGNANNEQVVWVSSTGKLLILLVIDVWKHIW